MTGILKSIILGVSTAALFGGIAMTLAHAGVMKEIVRLAAGVMVILSLLQPLSQIHIRLPTGWFHISKQPIERQVEEAKGQSKDMMAESTAKEIGAYLVRRANDQGIICKINVHASMDEENVVSLNGATISGSLSATELEWINTLLETECGISREVQTYVEN